MRYGHSILALSPITFVATRTVFTNSAIRVVLPVPILIEIRISHSHAILLLALFQQVM